MVFNEKRKRNERPMNDVIDVSLVTPPKWNPNRRRFIDGHFLFFLSFFFFLVPGCVAVSFFFIASISIDDTRPAASVIGSGALFTPKLPFSPSPSSSAIYYRINTFLVSNTIVDAIRSASVFVNWSVESSFLDRKAILYWFYGLNWS